MGRNKCKKIQPLQSLPIRSSPALLSCLRQPQAPSPEHPLRLLVFQTYRINSILCFTMSANSTPITASSNSNSKIPSKFFSANVVQDDHAPLWAYVSIIEKGSEAGGNKKWSCNFCQKEFRSSYSRVKAHLLRIYGTGISVCSSVNEEYLAELKSVVELAENRVKPKHVPLPTEKTQDNSSLKRRKSGPLERAFNLEDRDNLRSLIARMFYSSGLPFNLARNPCYVNSYLFAANHNLSGFIPPGYNALRTTLLQQEKAHVERLLKPIKSTWKAKGVSIVSDGWTDIQRRPLINFMAISEGGPIFLKAVDASDEFKNKHYIADRMAEVIKEVGEENVVQLITDNAPVCKGAGMIIESSFPKIFWTPCVVHTLNLALKNICAAKNTEKNAIAYGECSWITQVSDDVSFVRNFIMNHSMRLAIFNHFSPLKLLAVAETRFASIIVMLRRFKFLKRSLQSMVISEEWNSYREDDVGKAQATKEFILNDVWWDKIAYILDFTEPIYNMLRACDTDSSTLHLVYEMWDTMIEKVKTSIYRHEGKEPNDTSTFYEIVHSILIDRWTKSYTPLHCMAHSLNPRYYSDEWLQEAPNRIAPHEDEEISRERNKCLKKLFTTVEDRKKAALEYADFSSKANSFASFDSIEDRWTLDPKSWWVMHGSSAPLLQKLALRLLVQPSSSSCCERNWSTYSFIHSLKRNKLNPKRAEDLVYVHTNLRLLGRKSEEYNQGSTKMWDISGDAWDSFDGVGNLEVASLSLDEPDIEAVLFTDDAEGGDEIDTVPVSRQ